ncbi:MAG TPA: hypothetical protein VIL42_08560 [Sphingomicrobium sp.]|jgi:hypothetical protein
MKSVLLAASAVLLATPAFAQSIPLTEYGTFASRGQCESALAKERNAQRKGEKARGAGYENLSGSEFNKASRATTTCERTQTGEYAFMYDASAYDLDSDD